MDSGRNAALYAVTDGFDVAQKGINGRRVAGQSFLQGFFRHADVSEVVSVSNSTADGETFATLMAQTSGAPALPHRHVPRHSLTQIAPLGVMFYPAPDFSELAFERQAFGHSAYALCGITHTTSTLAVMKGFFQLRSSPYQPWDAVICTSRAVQAASLINLEQIDDYLTRTLGAGAARRALPLMPVIPLGLDVASYARDEGARKSLRTRMGWGKNDVVFTTLARLLPYGKFDPAPYFIALQAAQATLGTSRRLHVVMCGIYGDTHSQSVFEECARSLMPDVSFTHLDGADAQARKEALSGGDVFSFPIDNVQETFGLAPVEGMAAGLPVLASDWDGIRDTVTRETGILIPTRMISGPASAPEAKGHFLAQLSYAQYGNNLSAMTVLDQGAMREGIVALARDADLRARLGQAGLARARSLFDWSNIIPTYQALWAEQNAIRAAHAPMRPEALTLSPLPATLFAGYPSHQMPQGGLHLCAKATTARLREIYALRRYAKIGRPFEQLSTLERVFTAISDHAEAGVHITALPQILGWQAATIERAVMFLLKYDLIEIRA
ncbi:glycosyltransferase family 4 protein [Rhodobacteraceae bacterium XHP0102]|nr:glycosyltransferase family 4 protein [Rhodobacteraceae bacterium XHP0102]